MRRLAEPHRKGEFKRGALPVDGCAPRPRPAGQNLWIQRKGKSMIDSANHSSVTVHPLARAGSKPRRRWLIALLLPALILTASPEPVMATPVNKGTAIEYGLIAAGIAIAIITAVNGVGSALKGKFEPIKSQLGTDSKSLQNNSPKSPQSKGSINLSEERTLR
jgi:pilus assembly protein Flp/PilA